MDIILGNKFTHPSFERNIIVIEDFIPTTIKPGGTYTISPNKSIVAIPEHISNRYSNEYRIKYPYADFDSLIKFVKLNTNLPNPDVVFIPSPPAPIKEKILKVKGNRGPHWVLLISNSNLQASPGNVEIGDDNQIPIQKGKKKGEKSQT